MGTWLVGSQPLWPAPDAEVQDFFDRPPWERPTGDNGGLGDDLVIKEDFSGEDPPGFTGDETFDIDDGAGFDGILVGTGGGEWSWTPPIDGDSGGGTVTIITPSGPITINIDAERQKFYRIEVRDPDGDLLSRVPNWISGKLKLQVDRASELTFTVPLGEEGAADCVRPNTIWLRDRWGFVIDTFFITKRAPRGTGDASYFDLTCLSAIAQLGEEIVLEYSADEAPVSEHVAALLALQASGSPLDMGTIDDDIAEYEVPFFAGDTNIHAALLSLQAMLPRELRGSLYVDPQRRLQWRLAIGDQTEQVITREANVRGISAEVDYTRTINRIYFYGEGNDPATRLSLTDAGEANPYIEDTDSITANGLRQFLKIDRRFRKPESLLAVAQRVLEEFSTPPVTVSVDVLDLAKADDAPAGWQDLYIGGKYRVVDTDLALDSSIEITGIEVDLTQPVPIRVELANQVRVLSDIIESIATALYQPLDVDGDRYPTMGRNYSEQPARNERAGDVRWNPGAAGGGDWDGAPRGQMHDGTDWEDVGGGVASDDAGQPVVPEDPTAGTSEEYARADHDHLGMPWVTATEKSTLPSDTIDGVVANTTSATKKNAWVRMNGAWNGLVLDLGGVASPPAIPEFGTAMARFSGQMWIASAGDTYWTPLQRQTTTSGTP